MDFSWMIRALQVPWKSQPCILYVKVVIPGSQIPRWFKNQNVVSSISSDPLTVLALLACCVAFLARHDPTNLGNERDPWLMCGFRNEKKGHLNHFPVLIRTALVMVESDHLWLVHYPSEGFITITETWECDGTIKFDTRIEQPQGLHLEVKICGFRWLFKHDLEQLNATMMHNGSSNSIPIDDDLNSFVWKWC